MAYKLITQDASITLEFSTLVSAGQLPVYSGGANILTLTGTSGTGSEIGLEENLATVSVPGIGDTREKKRAKRGSSQLHIKKYVLSTGAVGGLTGVIGALTGSKLGFYAKVIIKELAALGGGSYEGLVTKFSWSGPDEAQVEELIIDCDAEHA